MEPKRRKLNEVIDISDDWGDDNFTADDFDEVQSQIQNPETTELNLSLGVQERSTEWNEDLLAQIGKITMLEAANEKKTKDLEIERHERAAIIESKISVYKKENEKLEKLLEKAKSEASFKEQELTNARKKIRTLEQNKPIILPSLTPIKAGPSKLLQKNAFEAKPIMKTNETQTFVENDLKTKPMRKSCLEHLPKRNNYLLNVQTKLQVNRCLIDQPVLFGNSKNSLKLFSHFSGNLDSVYLATKQCFCKRDISERAKLTPERDFFEKIRLNLIVYFETVFNRTGLSLSFGSPLINSSTSSDSDTSRKSPEPLKVRASTFFKSTPVMATRNTQEESWIQLQNTLCVNLKALTNLLEKNNASKNILIQTQFVKLPFLNELIRNKELKKLYTWSLGSLLSLAARPILCQNEVVNIWVLEWVLTVFCVLFHNTDRCCLEYSSTIIRDLCLSQFLEDKCENVNSALALEFLLICAPSSSVLELFTVHKGSCLLTSISRSIKSLRIHSLEEQSFVIQLILNLMIQLVIRNSKVFDASCQFQCFGYFFSSINRWINSVIANENKPPKCVLNKLMSFFRATLFPAEFEHVRELCKAEENFNLFVSKMSQAEEEHVRKLAKDLFKLGLSSKGSGHLREMIDIS